MGWLVSTYNWYNSGHQPVEYATRFDRVLTLKRSKLKCDFVDKSQRAEFDVGNTPEEWDEGNEMGMGWI